MGRQLNIRNDEAYRIAHEIADRTGATTTSVVTEALRQYATKKLAKHEPLSPEAQKRYDRFKALADESARHAKPGATSDHSDMYDEFGLPI